MDTYIRDISQLVLLYGFCDLVDLLGDILWGRSTVTEIILDSEIGVGTYSQ
jgi:hypothetical protein